MSEDTRLSSEEELYGEIYCLRSELATKDARINELVNEVKILGFSLSEFDQCRLESKAKDARIAELEAAGKELHRCLAAMVDRWEPDTEGLDRVMWDNACEALGRDIWAHLKTT